MSVSLFTLRSCLLYEFKLGTSATEAARKIGVAFGVGVISERVAQNWFRRFRYGDESLEDAPRSGRPIVVDDSILREAIELDPGQTCQQLADKFCVDEETIRLHLHQIGKVWRPCKWVPHALTERQKQLRFDICTMLLQRHHENPFLDHLITCDEKWIMHENTRLGHHWITPGEPPKKIPKPTLHPKKTMLCVWWSVFGIVHYEYLPSKVTITSQIYCEQLQRVREKIEKEHPALVGSVVFLHDNARPHAASATKMLLESFGWEVVPHPPYSPDISPTDFHLFLSMDSQLKNREFRDVGSVDSAMREFFGSKSEEFFRDGIYKLVTRWEKVIQKEESILTSK